MMQENWSENRQFEMKATADEMDMATMKMAKKMLDLY